MVQIRPERLRDCPRRNAGDQPSFGQFAPTRVTQQGDGLFCLG